MLIYQALSRKICNEITATGISLSIHKCHASIIQRNKTQVIFVITVSIYFLKKNGSFLIKRKRGKTQERFVRMKMNRC